MVHGLKYIMFHVQKHSISGNLLQSPLVNNKPLGVPAFVRLIYSGKMNILSFMSQIYGLLLSVRKSEVKPDYSSDSRN